jgi:hypothetical protein
MRKLCLIFVLLLCAGSISAQPLGATPALCGGPPDPGLPKPGTDSYRQRQSRLEPPAEPAHAASAARPRPVRDVRRGLGAPVANCSAVVYRHGAKFGPLLVPTVHAGWSR